MQNTTTAADTTRDALALRTGQEQWTAAQADRAEAAAAWAELRAWAARRRATATTA